MKKVLTTIVCMLALVAVLAGCGDMPKNYGVATDAEYAPNSVPEGSFSSYIIRTYDELVNLAPDHADKTKPTTSLEDYDEEFFKENDLFLLTVAGQPAGKTVDLKSVKIKDGTMKVVVKVINDKSPFASGTDANTHTIYFGQSKGAGITSISVQFD